jgi:SnoaL-like protein
MSPDHRFVDSVYQVAEGKSACRRAWASFFASFPDYRNVFNSVALVDDGHVVADGWTRCASPELQGEARWHAIVADDKIVEWRVEATDT